MSLVSPAFKTHFTIHICVSLAFICLLLSSITNLAGDIEVRKHVQEEYERTRFLLTKISNTILDDGKIKPLQYNLASDEYEIEVDTESFVVTLTFNNLPSSEARTIKFLPLVSTENSDMPLEAYLKSEQMIDQKEIRWVCTSSLVRSRRDYIRNNIGSLPSEIAPAKCRYWITPFDVRLGLN